MKRLLLALIILPLFIGCSKEDNQNVLVGTQWVYSTLTPTIDAYQLNFTTSDSGTMIYTPFGSNEQKMDFTYTFSSPDVVITYNGNSMTGTLSENTITFKGMGDKGSDMVFNKK